MDDELLHLQAVLDEVEAGHKAFALDELELLLPIIRRAIETGDTAELEEWAR